jgi:hypothetical protein
MSYQLRGHDRFFDVNRKIAETELHPGHTVTFCSVVDMSEAVALRRRRVPKPSYTALVVKAVALALAEHPYANQRVCPTWLGPRLQRFEDVDVAVAAEQDSPGRESVAFVDVLRRADGQDLGAITTWLRGLHDPENAQWKLYSGLIGRLPSWLASLLVRLPTVSARHWVRYRGGAALVSSPAKYGVDRVLGTWTHALGVSFGLVKERALVVDGRVVARPTCELTLNFDRRVMAGAPAARFFASVVRHLEQPTQGHLPDDREAKRGSSRTSVDTSRSSRPASARSSAVGSATRSHSVGRCGASGASTSPPVRLTT